MKISARNLGVLKQAEFELGDLTLICGDNNTGKTYATYALFGFLSNWRRLLSVDIPKSTIDVLVKDGVARIDVRTLVQQACEILGTGCDDYVDELAAVFASQSERFKPTEFRISLNRRDLGKAADRAFHGKWRGASEDTLFSFSKEKGDFDLVISLLTRDNNILPLRTIHEVISRAACELLFRRMFCRPFIASAERTGGTMFRDQLEYNPHQMSLFSRHEPDYPLPVQENVDFIRRLEQTVKADSFITRDHKHILAGFSDIIGGDYRVKDADTIYFKPTRRRLRLTMDESWIVYVEMKGGSDGLAKDIEAQLRGAHCLVAYCRAVGRQFWGESGFLEARRYREHYVSVKNVGSNKKPSWPSPRARNNTPETMWRFKNPPGGRLRFVELVEGNPSQP